MATILIIDDNNDFRVMLRTMLEKEGYEVTEAVDGKKGVESYREHPTDLVMIDMIMPNEDGIEAMSKLRREFKKMKFIIMSGGGNFGTAEEYLTSAESLGAPKILQKPFDRQTLVNVVKEALGGSQA